MQIRRGQAFFFFSFSVLVARTQRTQRVKWLHRREPMRLQRESIRSALLSLLNTDNPLLSPCMTRCCWLTQPAAGSHNSTLRSGRKRGSFLPVFVRTWRRVRRVLIALWLNVSVRANWVQSWPMGWKAVHSLTTAVTCCTHTDVTVLQSINYVIRDMFPYNYVVF